MKDQTARLAIPVELSWDNHRYLADSERGLELPVDISLMLKNDCTRLKTGKLNNRTDLFYHYIYQGYMAGEGPP